MTIQGNYSINPEVGFAGFIAEPNAPTYIKQGRLHIATGDGRQNPRPGDAVRWDSTNNAWRVPHNAATELLVSGVLTYRQDDVARADSRLLFADGDQVFVMLMGVIWVVAGGGVEQDDQIAYQNGDSKYNSVTRVTAIASLYQKPFVCYSASGVDNAIVKAAIGFGRVI